jgi:hypothetical protein
LTTFRERAQRWAGSPTIGQTIMGGLLALAVILIGFWLLSRVGVHGLEWWAFPPLTLLLFVITSLCIRAVAKRQ